MSGEIAVRTKGRTIKRYFPDSYYSLQADKELAAIGLSGSLPTASKLDYLCRARMNRWGHAPFEQGEMRVVLGGVTRATRNKALESLRRAKIIAPESTPLCVVLSSLVYRRADRMTTQCKEPGHAGMERLMWNHVTGWEEEPDYYQKMLDDPDGYAHVVKLIRTRTVTETETVEFEAAD